MTRIFLGYKTILYVAGLFILMEEVIVISSGEENESVCDKSEDLEVVFVKEVPAVKNATEKEFYLSRSKLNALKNKKSRHLHRHQTHNTQDKFAENYVGTSDTTSPSTSREIRHARIDRRKLKRLKAVVQIELSPSPTKSVKIKKENTAGAMTMQTPAFQKNSSTETVCSKSPSKNPFQYFNRSPQHKGQEFISPEKSQIPKTTPEKNQIPKTTPQKPPLITTPLSLAKVQNPKTTQSTFATMSPAKSKSLKTTQSNFPSLLSSPMKTQSPKTSPMKAPSISSQTSFPIARPSHQITPVKTQSTLKSWVTPTKRRKESPSTQHTFDVNSKRNEMVWPSDHVILNTQEFIKKLYTNPREFPMVFINLIESLQDEELIASVVKTIGILISEDLAPSSEMVWYLVNNVLLKTSDVSLISSTYTLLLEILERHPTKCIGMKITWEHINKHLTQEKSPKKPGNKLALSFLLSVLSVELKATALKSKKRLAKHFSADFHAHRVKEVMPCVRECLQRHTSTSIACETSALCSLEMLQSLLKLFMIVSSSKENAAIRLADEIMYLYIALPDLQEKLLLLQSVKSHLVRSHLIKVLLMNYCEVLPDALNDQDLPLCIRRIFLQDFYRQPPKHDGECGVNEVEEYVSLLAYLLQSYVAMVTLPGYHNDEALCNQDDVKGFSEDDLRYLQDLKFHVSNLRQRCEDFLNGEQLSVRSKLLFNVMEVVA